MKLRTRKLVTIHKRLSLESRHRQKFCESNTGGKELGSIKNCVDAVIQVVEEYINKSKMRS